MPQSTERPDHVRCTLKPGQTELIRYQKVSEPPPKGWEGLMISVPADWQPADSIRIPNGRLILNPGYVLKPGTRGWNVTTKVGPYDLQQSYSKYRFLLWLLF